MSKIRLHIPGVPHTITRSEFSNCAYAGKVLRFAPMMRSRGFEVYHYGVETSESGADVQIELMTKAEWNDLRIASYKHLHPEMTEDAILKRMDDPTTFVGELSNWDTPIWVEFNKRLAKALKANYRSTQTDIFCMPLYRYSAADNMDIVLVESGIGYDNPGTRFRIFESYAWMHKYLKASDNYWFVVPNYFNTAEWPLSLVPKVDTVGFLGRICERKGCYEIVEMAKKFPTVRFVLCGQGDPKPFMTQPNIVYKPPITGKERGDFLGTLKAALAPSQFIEPFCGAAVEAQLCGTPVMSKDHGATTETIENFKTGLRCHTLMDYCYGIQMALDDKFDRKYIHERAVRLYDMYNVAKQYEYVFKCILDVHNGKNGWYSPDSHIQILDTAQ